MSVNLHRATDTIAQITPGSVGAYVECVSAGGASDFSCRGSEPSICLGCGVRPAGPPLQPSESQPQARRRLLAVTSICKHYASMPHVLVRDVPEDVHAALQRKAERRHQSLQQYLAVELRHLAEQRSISEVLDEVEAQQGGRVGLQAAVADLDEERSRR